MFISVDLPAPFSPRSACTSPGSRSKSMWSLARTPGNRFVIPSSWRIGAEAIRGDPSARCGRLYEEKGAACAAPLFTSFLAELLLDRGRDAGDLVRLQQLVLGCDGGLDRGRDLRAPVPVADAVDVGAELLVGAHLELAGLGGLDRVVDRDIDLLEGAGHDPGAEVALVGVDADAEDVLAVRRVERAETARA